MPTSRSTSARSRPDTTATVQTGPAGRRRCASPPTASPAPGAPRSASACRHSRGRRPAGAPGQRRDIRGPQHARARSARAAGSASTAQLPESATTMSAPPGAGPRHARRDRRRRPGRSRRRAPRQRRSARPRPSPSAPARRPVVSAAARKTSGSGLPFRPSRRGIVPVHDHVEQLRQPAASSTARALRLDETSAVLTPAPRSRRIRATRAVEHLDAVCAPAPAGTARSCGCRARTPSRGRAGPRDRREAARSRARRERRRRRHSAAARRRARGSRRSVNSRNGSPVRSDRSRR